MKHFFMEQHPVQVHVPLEGRIVVCDATILSVVGSHLTITLPRRHHVPIPVKSDRLLLDLARPEALYRSDCSVLLKCPDHLRLAVPTGEGYTRIQRREHVRVPTRLACTIRIPTEAASPTGPWRGIIQNLSEGGILLNLPILATVDSVLEISFALPGSQETTLTAKVRHSRLAPAGDRGTYEAGCQFEALGAQASNLLRSYIMRVQYQILRRMRQDATA